MQTFIVWQKTRVFCQQAVFCFSFWFWHLKVGTDKTYQYTVCQCFGTGILPCNNVIFSVPATIGLDNLSKISKGLV
jgi:hypothetical protein